MALKNIVPPSLPELLARVAQWPDDAISDLELLISGINSTDPTSAEIVRFCDSHRIDEVDVRYLLSFISFLYDQLERENPDEIVRRLTSFFGETIKVSEPDELARLIQRFLSYKQQHDQSVKRARLKRGFGPYLVDVGSFVDIRPDFVRDEDGNLTGDIQGNVNSIQLMLEANTSSDDEIRFVVQLDEPMLERLAKVIAEIQQKLAIIGDGSN
jgi:hypothetical protein